MKKIIDRKRYDTETATKIVGWKNQFFPNDFKYCHEVLYRTQKGAYFLFGEGGGLSKYARAAGSNGWGSGENIHPLSRKEAIEWLEKTDNIEAAELEFSDLLENA